MTFIASVIAKNGVAIIADSIVTTSQPIIEYSDFIHFFEEKSKEAKDAIKLDPHEIINLFNSRPHHTKDYEQKLFMYDQFTSVTTAGAAILNDQKIVDIIEKIIGINKKNRGYLNKKIETKVKDLCKFLTDEVKDHLSKHTTVRSTTLIITNYSPKENKSSIFKVNIISSSQKDLEAENYKLVDYLPSQSYEKVVCDGQNRISERVLFGDIFTVYNLIPKIVEQVAKDFGIKNESVTKDYISSLLTNKDILPKNLLSDAKIFRLSELSLQQAVDLASLLMRLEIDFQSYTEDIPTVGGVVKLAVIDKNGFRFIAGDDITKPNNI